MARGPSARERHPGLSTTLRQVVEGLREQALKCAEGDLLGSEDDLLARYRVSRPTLRQAAALVAQEQLLQVRRGVGGGYIARRPTSRAVAHMAAIFLRTSDTSLEELSRSMAPIRAELSRLAASHLDETSRQAFREFLRREAEAANDVGGGFRGFASSEREFGQLLGAASGNHVLSLFQDIVFDLAANIPPEHDILQGRPDRVKDYRDRRARLVDAILAGDPSVAGLLSYRVTELSQQWRDEDAAGPHPVAAIGRAAAQ